MSTDLGTRQKSNFPTVDQFFLVVKLPLAAHGAASPSGDLMPQISIAVAAIANTHSRPDWPRTPKSIVIGNPHATNTVYLWSTNGGQATTEGLPIPPGQSLFIGWSTSTIDVLRYEAASPFSVAVYF